LLSGGRLARVISVVFEYEVEAAARAEFERVYGSDGDWARFFRDGDGYLGTELLEATEDRRSAPGATHRLDRRFLVVDRWTTETAYARFLAANAEEYERRSVDAARLYLSETRIGSFARVGVGVAPELP
jgi:heme-degrading monooxygenase HmoA